MGKRPARAHNTGMEAPVPTARSSRRLPLTATVVAATLILVVVVLAALRPATRYEDDTPEGVVQSYFTALFEGDHRTAMDHLTAELRTTCDLADFRRAWIPPRARVSLLGTEIDGAEALVRLRLMEGGGGPFDEYHQDLDLVLVRQGASWAISEVPWPVVWCAPEEAP
jgi:hypothetical protein